MYVKVRFLNPHPLRRNRSSVVGLFTYDAPDWTEPGDLVLVPTSQGTKYARVESVGVNYTGKIKSVYSVFRQIHADETNPNHRTGVAHDARV